MDLEMKIFTTGLAQLIHKIESGEIKALVMHGPNQGFISSSLAMIEKKLSLAASNYSAKDLSASKLSIIANSKNFFAQREIIKITSIPNTITKEMKELLSTGDFYHFVCFIAQDSLPASGLRKFFEEQKHLAILACYFDNEQTIAKLILEQCKNRQKQIDEDALFYLKSHLKGDHQIIKSELEKLFYYTHDKTTITKGDILVSLSQDFVASGDDMCVHFSKKEPLKLLKEIDKLKQQGVNEVLMIRALLRYFFNVYSVTSRVEGGEDIDRAIKSISPPIFFKYVDDFKQIVRIYSSDDSLRYINTLQEAEVSYKQNPSCFDLFSIYTRLQEESIE
jgi:DNA polymerase-3 subunit delta